MAPRAKREHPPEAAVPPVRIPMSELEIEAFYRGVFLPLVRRATWKHRLSKEDAADIVQDAFLLALGKLDSAGNPNAWLIQVVDHLAMNLNRKTSRRARLSGQWGCEGESRDSAGECEMEATD